jgi:hypothetical protein
LIRTATNVLWSFPDVPFVGNRRRRDRAADERVEGLEASAVALPDRNPAATP